MPLVMFKQLVEKKKFKQIFRYDNFLNSFCASAITIAGGAFSLAFMKFMIIPISPIPSLKNSQMNSLLI